MDGYLPETYGETWADIYDDAFPLHAPAMIDFLASLAGSPPRAFELAIGTGRVAIPLAGAGVDVSGIDISQAMVDKLREKPGGEEIEVQIGNMAEFEVTDPFPLVYLPFNTFFALTEQRDQVSCMKSVYRALVPGGRFVVQAFLPDLYRYAPLGERMSVVSLDSTRGHTYEMATVNPITQRLDVHVVRRNSDGDTEVRPISLRYCWPEEMDLMAQIAGLTLENRWAWYDRSPFGTDSPQHVSVYLKT